MQLEAQPAAAEYCRKVGRAFYPLRIERSDSENLVVTRFTSQRNGCLRITRGSVLTSAPIYGRRHWSDIATTTPDEFLLMGAISTSLAYRQFDRRVEIEPGQMVLLDARTPYHFERRSAGSIICHHLPGAVIRQITRHPEDLCARVIDGRRGVGATLQALLHSVVQQADALTELERYSLLETASTLLQLASRGTAPEKAAPRPLREPAFRRLMAYIEANICDPSLCPRSVAAAAGISVGHAHALASRHGTTIGRIILNRRLDLCARALAAPENAGMRITDIAFQHGFNDSAHFSRAFKRGYGVSASQYRQRSAAGSSQLPSG